MTTLLPQISVKKLRLRLEGLVVRLAQSTSSEDEELGPPRRVLRRKWAQLESMVGTDKGIALVAEDLVKHWDSCHVQLSDTRTWSILGQHDAIYLLANCQRHTRFHISSAIQPRAGGTGRRCCYWFWGADSPGRAGSFPPAPPQSRTSPIEAYGSSVHGFAL